MIISIVEGIIIIDIDIKWSFMFTGLIKLHKVNFQLTFQVEVNFKSFCLKL